MVKIYHKTIKNRELRALDNFRIGSWIYVENPSKDELDLLTEKFHLEIGLLKDALDPFEVPRLEINNGVVYIFTRAPFQEKERIATAPLMVAVGENFIITIAQGPFAFFEKFLNNEIKFTTTQKTKLLLQIFSEITSFYNTFLTGIIRNVRGISIQMEKIENKDIIRFVMFENILNDFLAALVPTNTILNNIISGSHAGKILGLYEEDKNLIEDLFLSNTQLIELCRANLKTIVNIRESYSTIMTNNLNRVIKFFTALTIIMTIPMIISSFYGMNINLPFAKHPLAFWILLGTTFVISCGLLIIFIKKRWL